MSNAKEHIVRKDYSALDLPEVVDTIFHPLVVAKGEVPVNCLDHDIEVDDGVRVGARFHLPEEKTGANILHGPQYERITNSAFFNGVADHLASGFLKSGRIIHNIGSYICSQVAE